MQDEPRYIFPLCIPHLEQTEVGFLCHENATVLFPNINISSLARLYTLPGAFKSENISNYGVVYGSGVIKAVN